MPTGADKKIKLFDSSGGEIKFIGKVNTFGYGCRLLGQPYVDSEIWALVAYSHPSEPRAAYILDREAQIYSNILEEETKEPVLINGDTDQVESSKDLERVDLGGSNFRSVISKNRFVKVENLKMEYSEDNLVFGVSVAMTITCHSLPQSGDGQVTILSMKSDKVIEVKIDKDGEFYVYLDDVSSPWNYSKEKINENVPLAVKLYLGKSLEVQSGIASMSVHFIDSNTSDESEEGIFFDCKFNNLY